MFVRSKRYPLGKTFRRSTLRLMLSTMYVLYPLGCILQFAALPGTFSVASHVTGLLMVAAALTIFAALAGSSLQRQSQEQEAQLDERELAERNRAAYGAHAIFAGLVLLGVIYLMVAKDLVASGMSGLWIPETSDQWNAVFWGLLLAALTLPGAVLAWGRGAPADEVD